MGSGPEIRVAESACHECDHFLIQKAVDALVDYTPEEVATASALGPVRALLRNWGFLEQRATGSAPF